MDTARKVKMWCDPKGDYMEVTFEEKVQRDTCWASACWA